MQAVYIHKHPAQNCNIVLSAILGVGYTDMFMMSCLYSLMQLTICVKKHCVINNSYLLTYSCREHFIMPPLMPTHCIEGHNHKIMCTINYLATSCTQFVKGFIKATVILCTSNYYICTKLSNKYPLYIICNYAGNQLYVQRCKQQW